MAASYISRLPQRPDPRETPDTAELPEAAPRRLVLLGATGSIGTSALKVVAAHPERFQVLALAGGRNAKLLAEQAVRFRPAHLAVLDHTTAELLRRELPEPTADWSPEIHVGREAFVRLAELDEADMVLSAIVGAAGLPPTYAAVKAGKTVALANKESLVLAGHLIRRRASESGAVILPVDSEHNALFQALSGERFEHVAEVILTASGGPFRGRSRADLESVTREQALKHPNWSMGAKITIDSATLMNKGLEVIEACHLYGLDESRVATVVHPQSIVHGLVRYIDGSLIAHLGPPDMQIAIAHCLTYPDRVELPLAPLDLVELGKLTFEAPDTEVFTALALAREAVRQGPSHTTVLNAANEIAVELFLQDRIGFLDIPRLIEAELARHVTQPLDCLDAVLALDREVRERMRAAHGQAGPDS